MCIYVSVWVCNVSAGAEARRGCWFVRSWRSYSCRELPSVVLGTKLGTYKSSRTLN